jgi:hypothetical protein
MSIINRRNALVGWLAWNVAKRVIARKARQAVPTVDTDAKRPNKPAIIAALATLGIGAWLARHYTEGDEGDA